MLENYQIFEDLINLNLCDNNATITGCKLGEHFGSTVLKVFYTVSDEYAKKEELNYKERIMEIVLRRGPQNQGLPVCSYANTQGVS